MPTESRGKKYGSPKCHTAIIEDSYNSVYFDIKNALPDILITNKYTGESNEDIAVNFFKERLIEYANANPSAIIDEETLPQIIDALIDSIEVREIPDEITGFEIGWFELPDVPSSPKSPKDDLGDDGTSEDDVDARAERVKKATKLEYGNPKNADSFNGSHIIANILLSQERESLVDKITQNLKEEMQVIISSR